MAVIIQVEQLSRRASRCCTPHNTQTCDVPDKVISPPIAARIEERDDFRSLRVASFEAIPTAFITVAAGQRQVVGIIRTASRLGQHMVNSEAHELPSFVGMAILAAAMRARMTRRVPGDTAMMASMGAGAACEAIEPT